MKSALKNVLIIGIYTLGLLIPITLKGQIKYEQNIEYGKDKNTIFMGATSTSIMVSYGRDILQNIFSNHDNIMPFFSLEYIPGSRETKTNFFCPDLPFSMPPFGEIPADININFKQVGEAWVSSIGFIYNLQNGKRVQSIFQVNGSMYYLTSDIDLDISVDLKLLGRVVPVARRKIHAKFKEPDFGAIAAAGIRFYMTSNWYIDFKGGYLFSTIKCPAQVTDNTNEQVQKYDIDLSIKNSGLLVMINLGRKF